MTAIPNTCSVDLGGPATRQRPGPWPHLQRRCDVAENTCDVDGCGKPRKYVRAGLCSTHYARLRRNGTVERVRDGDYDRSVRDLSDADRFWRRVEVGHPLGCWVWTGGRSSNGYGVFAHEPRKPNGRLTQTGAHRYAFTLLKGPIPEGFHLDHLCRRPECVNPDHLEAVTPRENTLRGVGPSSVNATATECVNGHRLTQANVWLNPKTGARHCRPCMRRRWHEWNARKVAS